MVFTFILGYCILFQSPPQKISVEIVSGFKRVCSLGSFQSHLKKSRCFPSVRQEVGVGEVVLWVGCLPATHSARLQTPVPPHVAGWLLPVIPALEKEAGRAGFQHHP